jgi:hypothetical protein
MRRDAIKQPIVMLGGQKAKFSPAANHNYQSSSSVKQFSLGKGVYPFPQYVLPPDNCRALYVSKIRWSPSTLDVTTVVRGKVEDYDRVTDTSFKTAAHKRYFNFGFIKRLCKDEPVTLYVVFDTYEFSFVKQSERLKWIFRFPEAVPLITILPVRYFKGSAS